MKSRENIFIATDRMKRIRASFLKFSGLNSILLMASLLSVASCGGDNKGDSDSASSVTTTPIDTVPDMAVAIDSTYAITSSGIGPVRIGTRVADIPDSVPGLYDRCVVEPTPDAVAYTYLHGDTAKFAVYDFMQGNVDVVILEGKALTAETPAGTLRIGDPFSNVLKIKEAYPEWQSIDGDGEEGTWYWRYNGLFIGIDETDADDALLDIIFDGTRAPRASAIGNRAKIGYIGTGLPF